MLIPEENRIKLDVHGYTVEEVKYELDVLLDYLDNDIKLIIVVHGFKYGNRLLNFLRNEYSHVNIEKIVPDANPGVTLIYVKPNRVKGLGKKSIPIK